MGKARARRARRAKTSIFYFSLIKLKKEYISEKARKGEKRLGSPLGVKPPRGLGRRSRQRRAKGGKRGKRGKAGNKAGNKERRVPALGTRLA